MEITIDQDKGSVKILRLSGKLDGSNYKDLIEAAQKLYDAGIRDIVMDLSQLTFISSAGISALHRIAKLFQGQKQAALEEEGWSSYHAIANDRGAGFQEHVKLFGPQENVHHSLEVVGFTDYFQIFSSMDQAVSSFQ